MDAAEKIEPFVPEEIWPRFTFTAEENKILQSTGRDIEKFVEEMRDQFILGDADLEDWDDYVNEIEKSCIDEVVEVYLYDYDRSLDIYNICFLCETRDHSVVVSIY